MLLTSIGQRGSQAASAQAMCPHMILRLAYPSAAIHYQSHSVAKVLIHLHPTFWCQPCERHICQGASCPHTALLESCAAAVLQAMCFSGVRQGLPTQAIILLFSSA